MGWSDPIKNIKGQSTSSEATPEYFGAERCLSLKISGSSKISCVIHNCPRLVASSQLLYIMLTTPKFIEPHGNILSTECYWTLCKVIPFQNMHRWSRLKEASRIRNHQHRLCVAAVHFLLLVITYYFNNKVWKEKCWQCSLHLFEKTSVLHYLRMSQMGPITRAWH